MDIFPTQTYTNRMSVDDPGTPAAAFSRVMRSLLRPLVRALIAQGVTAPAFYRIIKRVYVEVAEHDFKLDDERQTDSRISMLTGVHRRDVRSFRDADRSADTAAQEKVTTLATVLGRWLASDSTRDADGRPLPLPRSGDGANFEALVQAVSKDIRPRTVLDELVRQGLVEVVDGHVHVRADAFLGPSDPDQKIHFFAENVGDHIAAAVDNLLAEEPVFMERAVFYNRLTPGSVDAIEGEAKRLGGAALAELNQLAHARQAADLDAPDGTKRFRFGVFFYAEDEGATEDGAETDDDDKS
ncbi:MAG: DUF6502 family protein [Pseudomonadota bacterium]